jgi:hypothetical protein
MTTKKIATEGFASVDGQSVLPDPAISGSASRPADQTNGETSYATTTKAEVMAKILGNLQAGDTQNAMDVYSAMQGPSTTRPADQTAGEMNPIRLSPTSVGASNAMESVTEIFTGTELSEDLKTKAAAVFEATVNARISIVEARLEEESAKALEETVELMHTELVEAVDKYMSYVAKEWVEENKIAIDSGIKGQMAESLITALKGIFEDHYISIPEEAVNVVESLTQEVEGLKTRLNESTETIIDLSNQVEKSTIKDIVSEASDGLTLSQKDKFLSLVENVSYTDMNEFTSKVSAIKESVFTTKVGGPSSQPLTEDISGEPEPREVSPMMKRYVESLSKSVNG